MVAAVIVLVVLASVAADIFAFLWWYRRLRKEAIDAVREDVGRETVHHVEDCNFFGLQSSGLRQWRGNGVIALTDKGIRFRMFLPRKDLTIPLASIEGVSRPRVFLGKTKAKDLLRVDFRDREGAEDACAWLVPSLPWWEEALEALRAGKEPPGAPWELEKP